MLIKETTVKLLYKRFCEYRGIIWLMLMWLAYWENCVYCRLKNLHLEEEHIYFKPFTI